MERTADILFKAHAEQGALALLPKSVRLLRGGGADGSQGLDAMCEFEVVSGNAAYQTGERFFLSPVRARRAYLGPQA